MQTKSPLASIQCLVVPRPVMLCASGGRSIERQILKILKVPPPKPLVDCSTGLLGHSLTSVWLGRHRLRFRLAEQTKVLAYDPIRDGKRAHLAAEFLKASPV